MITRIDVECQVWFSSAAGWLVNHIDGSVSYDLEAIIDVAEGQLEKRLDTQFPHPVVFGPVPEF